MALLAAVYATLLPGLPASMLLLLALASIVLWRLSRRLLARSATAAFARGEADKSRRRYWLLWISSLFRDERRCCQLSLAACLALEEKYEEAVRRSATIGDLAGEAKAASLNLQAYGKARLGQDLESALSHTLESLAIRPGVPSFLHTKGLVLFELGRLEEAVRAFEKSWKEEAGSARFESERSFDLGRLWRAKSQEDYAGDYFQRAIRADPEGVFGQKARAECGAQLAGSNTSLSPLDDLIAGD